MNVSHATRAHRRWFVNLALHSVFATVLLAGTGAHRANEPKLSSASGETSATQPNSDAERFVQDSIAQVTAHPHRMTPPVRHDWPAATQPYRELDHLPGLSIQVPKTWHARDDSEVLMEGQKSRWRITDDTGMDCGIGIVTRASGSLCILDDRTIALLGEPIKAYGLESRFRDWKVESDLEFTRFAVESRRWLAANETPEHQRIAVLIESYLYANHPITDVYSRNPLVAMVRRMPGRNGSTLVSIAVFDERSGKALGQLSCLVRSEQFLADVIAGLHPADK